MCEIVSAATMATAFGTGASALTVMDVVSVGGTILSAVGTMQQSQARSDQAAYQAAVSRNNQIIADRKAADITVRGKIAENKKKQQVRQLKSRQLVGLAGQGVDVTAEGEVNLLADTAELGAMDAQAIRTNTARDAYSTRIQAMNFGNQASLYQMQSNAENPLLAGGATMLSGFGQISKRWYKQGNSS